MRKIVKFEKEDCKPCVMVSQYLEDKSVPYEAVNPFNRPELAIQYRVRSVPTTLLLEDEKEIMRIVGFQPEELNAMIDLI